jgi:hypothetical protein
MNVLLFAERIKLKSLLFLLSWVNPFPLCAQEFYLPLNRNHTQFYEAFLYRTDTAAHTSFRPFRSSVISRYVNLDSCLAGQQRKDSFYNRWIGRKLFYEHLLHVKEEDYQFYLDPLFEFRVMKSGSKPDEWYYINTRGVQVGGMLGQRFSFYSSFYESQSLFPDYMDSLVRALRIVPGGGRIKRFYSSAFDYSIASGTISYSLKKFFNFQFGHDKVFIGDGYRSLLLSDHAFNYPFLKITTSFWKINYVNLYTVMQDMKVPVPDEESFIKKYGSFHYLSVLAGKRLTIGLMEAIIWKSDSLRNRNIDINYLNPVIFMRPVEFSLNSPDNALLGINLRYTLARGHALYGQAMLDEFKLSEVRAGKGWWANKQAFQIGYRCFNFPGIPGVHVLTEFNYVRPYTYQHKSTLTAYTHNNTALAHPLGANFYEWLTIINYRMRSWHAELKTSVVKIGYDRKLPGNQVINYGQNVLLSYFTHPDEYGNKVAQGITTHQLTGELRVWYLFNPKTNFIVEAGVTVRRKSNLYGVNTTALYFIGIRTALTNRYFDV